MEEQIDQLKGVFHKLLNAFRLGDVIPTLILAAFLATLIGAGLRPAFFAGLGEGRFYRIVFWSLFSILSVLLAFHVYLVYVIWSHLRAILGQVSRLPLARSFERMPARVARWFFESPTQRNRSAMIQDQAVALAGRYGQVRAALERVISPDAISSREWDALPARLMRINDPSTDSRSQADGGWIFVRSWPAAVRPIPAQCARFCALSPAGRRSSHGCDFRMKLISKIAIGVWSRARRTAREFGSRDRVACHDGRNGTATRSSRSESRHTRDLEERLAPDLDRETADLDLRRRQNGRTGARASRRRVADPTGNGSGPSGQPRARAKKRRSTASVRGSRWPRT